MIGLSLSFCVTDVLECRVNADQISKVIAGTKAPTQPDWDAVICAYRGSYWRKNPEAAEAIVRKWIAEGKIVQPRLEGKSLPNIAAGHWVEREDQIVYEGIAV